MQFKRLRNAAAFVVAGMAYVDPSALLFLGTCSLVGFLAEDQAIVAAHIAADPPRKDFEVETRARSAVIDPAPLGRDAMAVAARETIVALDRADAQLDAMIRAIERAQGAALALNDDIRDQRVAEAFAFAQNAGEWLAAFQDSGAYLAERLEEGEETRRTRVVRPATADGRRGQPLADLLPDSVQATLYRAGVPIGRLRAPLKIEGEIPTQPLLAFTYNLRGSALQAGSYGRELRRGSEAFALRS